MRQLPIAAVVAAATITLTQIATAADLPVKAPVYKAPPPVLSNWTGFYVGVNVGGGWGRRTVDFTPNDTMASFLFAAGGMPPSDTFTTSGVLGGIQVGYNWQLETRWLFGFETDFNGSGLKGSGSTSGIFAPYGIGAVNALVPFNAPVEERVDWFGTVRARLGYLPTDNLLVYATGGFAYGRVEQSGSWVDVGPNPYAAGGGGFDFSCVPNSTCFAGSSSHIGTGWTAGGGLEYAFWQKWTLKAEYLYVSLDSRSLTESAGPAFSPGELPASFNANFSRTNFNVARVGLNYRF